MSHFHRPNLKRHRRLLLVGSLIVVLSSVTALAFASQRIEAEEAAFSLPAAGRCVPSTLNRSAVLPGTTLAVTPLPDSYDALPRTQISLLGVAPVVAVRHRRPRLGERARTQDACAPTRRATARASCRARPSSPARRSPSRARSTRPRARHGFSFHFVVAHEDAIPEPPSVHPSKDPNEKMHFHSQPGPRTARASSSPARTPRPPGATSSPPRTTAPGQAGPMIFDEAGELVWFQPVPSGDAAADLKVQQLGGKPVLTWWQGYIPPAGFGKGEEVIDDSLLPPDRPRARGQRLQGRPARIQDHPAGDGPASPSFQPIRCDLSSLGGPRGGAVTDSLMQEIDLRTGPRAQGVAQPRPRLARELLQQRRHHQHEEPVRLLPPELDRPARQRAHADLGAQHVGALRTEHADGPDPGDDRRQELDGQARRRHPHRLPARRGSAARTATSASSTTAACRWSTPSRAR